MDPILILGREKLLRIGDPMVPADEREHLRAEMWTMLRTEQGIQLRDRLLDAFNGFDLADLRMFPPATYRWYLDWLSDQGASVLTRTSPSFLSLLWLSFTDRVLRMRVVEAGVAVEEIREAPPSDSMFVGILMHLVEHRGETERWDSEPVAELIDALLTVGRPHALRVIGAGLRRAPDRLAGEIRRVMTARLATLDASRASDMQRLVEEGGRSPGEDYSE